MRQLRSKLDVAGGKAISQSRQPKMRVGRTLKLSEDLMLCS